MAIMIMQGSAIDEPATVRINSSILVFNLHAFFADDCYEVAFT